MTSRAFNLPLMATLFGNGQSVTVCLTSSIALAQGKPNYARPKGHAVLLTSYQSVMTRIISVPPLRWASPAVTMIESPACANPIC